MQKNIIKKESACPNRYAKRCGRGYTIIETMIAVSLFIIIVMIGMNALLNANVLHQKSQNMRSIMDNLSFVMEDMGRNMRVGSNYHCINNGVFTGLTTPLSCASGGAIAFKNSLDGSIWVYKIESSDGGVTFNIFKSVDGATTWVQLNPPEIVINSVSGFSVLGAEPPPGDLQQPLVTIRLVGSITYKNVVTPFSLQTSVSQRMVDI
jgi:type II secretory pathway pseudopilin PulG